MRYQIFVEGAYLYFNTREAASAELQTQQTDCLSREKDRFTVAKIVDDGLGNTIWSNADLDSGPENHTYNVFNHATGQHEAVSTLTAAKTRVREIQQEFLVSLGMCEVLEVPLVTPISTFALGSSTTKSTETVIFAALVAGQSATVNGLTFTATAAITDIEVGAAFSGVLSGETAALVAARNTASAALGVYSGTNKAGYASELTTTATVIYTSVDNAAATFGTPTSSTVPVTVFGAQTF